MSDNPYGLAVTVISGQLYLTMAGSNGRECYYDLTATLLVSRNPLHLVVHRNFLGR